MFFFSFEYFGFISNAILKTNFQIIKQTLFSQIISSSIYHFPNLHTFNWPNELRVIN